MKYMFKNASGRYIFHLIIILSVITAFIVSCSSDVEKPSFPEMSVGDKILFGNYRGEDIEWIVKDMDTDSDKVLLVSSCAIEAMMFSDDYSTASSYWEISSLRSWLNNDFYEDSFSDEEKGRILTTTVINSGNPALGVEDREDTEDKIFLLSLDEIDRYFTDDEDRRCPSSEEAGGRVNTINGSCFWWLRTSGQTSNLIAFIGVDGYINEIGDMIHDRYGIRPAMWIRLH